jgi:hypothetical protein
VDSLTLTYLILGTAGALGASFFAVWILAPAWTSYGRTWERVAAAFLSIFVLAAFAGVGIGIGLVIVYYWDQILEFLHLESAALLF